MLHKLIPRHRWPPRSLCRSLYRRTRIALRFAGGALTLSSDCGHGKRSIMEDTAEMQILSWVSPSFFFSFFYFFYFLDEGVSLVGFETKGGWDKSGILYRNRGLVFYRAVLFFLFFFLLLEISWIFLVNK